MYSFELNGLLILGLPTWIIIRMITLIKRRKKGIKFNFKHEVSTNLFVIYLFFLVGITILPIYIGGIQPHIQNLSFVERCNLNIVPFINYFNNVVFYEGFIRGVIRNVAGNLVLLIPFILYLCFKNEKFRSLKSSMIIAFFISLSIEFIQLLMNILGCSDLRIVDIEDLILNTLGGAVAWCMFKVVNRLKIKSTIDNTHGKIIEES